MTGPARGARKVRGDSGFTLIEVVVSLAILAIAMAMMPGTFRLAQRAWSSVAQIERAESWASERTFIEQRLTEAMPILVTDAGGERRLGFAGGPSRLTFVAPSAAGPAGGGLYRWTLSVEEASATRALRLQQALVQGTQARHSDADERILFVGLEGPRFRYFGATFDEGERRWLDSWPDGDRLPELVELSASPSGSRPLLPRFETLIVALRLRRPD